jgi:hypothetical protein
MVTNVVVLTVNIHEVLLRTNGDDVVLMVNEDDVLLMVNGDDLSFIFYNPFWLTINNVSSSLAVVNTSVPVNHQQ